MGGLFALLLLLSLPTQGLAITLTYTDSYALGSIVPGVPDSNEDRLELLNALIAAPAGTSTYNASFNGAKNPYTLDATGNSSGVLATGPGSDHIGLSSYDVSGYSYLIAHYGAGGALDLGGGDGGYFFAWDVSTLSTIDIPSGALSDFTLFGGGTPSVADGGTTAMLLGAAMLLMSFFARRRKLA